MGKNRRSKNKLIQLAFQLNIRMIPLIDMICQDAIGHLINNLKCVNKSGVISFLIFWKEFLHLYLESSRLVEESPLN